MNIFMFFHNFTYQKKLQKKVIEKVLNLSLPVIKLSSPLVIPVIDLLKYTVDPSIRPEHTQARPRLPCLRTWLPEDCNKLIQSHFSKISMAKAVADVVRTSLGPKGMDEMAQDGKIHSETNAGVVKGTWHRSRKWYHISGHHCLKSCTT